MADYDASQLAGVELPLVEPATNTLLRDADPTVYFALEFFAAVIERAIGDRLVAAATEASVPRVVQAVAYKVPMDPGPYLTEQQFKFPLLAVYRKNETYRERTAVFQQDIAELEVAYVLPPLNGAQTERIGPVLRAVAAALFTATEQGFDSDYESSALVWGEDYANVEEIGFTRGEYGSFPTLKDLAFPAWVGTLRVKERTFAVTSQFDEFDGLDASVDVVVGDTTVSDLAEITTEPGPSITAISTSAGSSAGGLSVTITGTDFSERAEVWFGSTQATVVAATSTAITITTPASPAYPSTTVDVIVVNPDGQTDALEGAFTFATSLDPADLTLKMLLLPGSYNDASPATWTGTASAGTSGTYNAVDDGGTPPTDALCAGLTVAKFFGTRYFGSVPKVLSQIVSASAGTLGLVLRPATAIAEATSAETSAIVFGDAASLPNLVVAYDASGIRVGARDAGGWNELVAVPATLGADSTAIVTWDGVTLKATVNGGAWESVACGPLADVSQPYIMGTNYNGTIFYTGAVKMAFASPVAITDEERDGVTAFIQTLPWWDAAVA